MKNRATKAKEEVKIVLTLGNFDVYHCCKSGRQTSFFCKLAYNSIHAELCSANLFSLAMDENLSSTPSLSQELKSASTLMHLRLSFEQSAVE